MLLVRRWTTWSSRGRRESPFRVLLHTVTGTQPHPTLGRGRTMRSTSSIPLVCSHMVVTIARAKEHQATSTSQSRSSVLCASWTAPSSSFALLRVCKARPRPSIGKCADMESHGCRSSIKWIGELSEHHMKSGNSWSSRPGANPWRIIQQIRSKLRIPAAAVQVPIGVEDGFKGVVDLIRWKAVYNEGEKGYVTSVIAQVNKLRLEQN